jgi:hypothetical protein
MVKRTVLVVSAVLLAASQQGGCGDGGGRSSGGGDQQSALNCILDLQFTGPTKGQLIATVDATCDFLVASSQTSLVILGKPAGSSQMSWQAISEPKTSTQIPPVSLTYAALCSPGEWEASASITGVGPNAQPFHSTSTDPMLEPLTKADCLGSP